MKFSPKLQFSEKKTKDRFVISGVQIYSSEHIHHHWRIQGGLGANALPQESGEGIQCKYALPPQVLHWRNKKYIQARKKKRLRRSNINAKTGASSGIRQWGSKRMRGPVTGPKRTYKIKHQNKKYQNSGVWKWSGLNPERKWKIGVG